MKPFQYSLSDYVAQRKQSAIEDVRRLSFETLSDPSLAGELDKIADKYTPDVPVLLEPSRADKVSDNQLLVHIPFTGDANLIDLCPSNLNDPQLPFYVEGNDFVVQIDDDNRVTSRVAQFHLSIKMNLQSLKQDFDRAMPSLRTDLNTAANQRLSELQADKTRHASLPFPVRDKRPK